VTPADLTIEREREMNIGVLPFVTLFTARRAVLAVNCEALG
jgi:hypothetical protein